MATRLAHTCSMIELSGLGYSYTEEDLKTKLEHQINHAYRWYSSTFPQDGDNRPACIFCKGSAGQDFFHQVMIDRGFQKVMEYPTPHKMPHMVEVYILPGFKNGTA